MGDGPAGGAMGSKPANFHDDKVKSQPDGSLFWKISEGRGTMPPFKEVLSEEQRWQLVSFIRKLGRGSLKPYNRASPVPLRSDIAVEHFLTIEPQAIRILYEPKSDFFGYSTYSGEVFRIITDEQGKRRSEKIIGVAKRAIAEKENGHRVVIVVRAGERDDADAGADVAHDASSSAIS